MDLINQDYHQRLVSSWEAMGEGAPMLSALAGICARAVLDGPRDQGELSQEEKAILFAARHRGVIEVRGVPTAFEATMRFLAVYVEVGDHERIEFRVRHRPELTIRFFDAFAILCVRGLVLHHLHHDFSLSRRGFDAAHQINEEEVSELLRLVS